MRKLLSVITILAVFPSVSLPIISCTNSKAQKIIDNAIKQLKDKKLFIVVTDGKKDTVKKAIINHQNFKAILDDPNSKVDIKSFEFIKQGYVVDEKANFIYDDVYEVLLTVTKTSNGEKGIKEGKIRFEIDLKIDNSSLQKLQEAGLKLKELKTVNLKLQMNYNLQRILSTNNCDKIPFFNFKIDIF